MPWMRACDALGVVLGSCGRRRSYSFEGTGGATTIAIHGSKKHDRGRFNVYLNNTYVGSGASRSLRLLLR
jgi:hypothetical protein